jgi:hypothetical protein
LASIRLRVFAGNFSHWRIAAAVKVISFMAHHRTQR